MFNLKQGAYIMNSKQKALLKKRNKNERTEILQQLNHSDAFQSRSYTERQNNKKIPHNTKKQLVNQLMLYRHTKMEDIFSQLLSNIENEDELNLLIDKYISLDKMIVSTSKNKIHIKKGTNFYRAVPNPNFITKPPVCKTKLGRLNKKEEPVLYLAFSPETAYSEVQSDYILHFIAKKDFDAICSFNPTLDETFNSIERELDGYKNELCNRIMSLTQQKCNLSNNQIYSLTNKLKDKVRDYLTPALLYPSTKLTDNIPLSIANKIIDNNQKNNIPLNLLNCVIFEHDEELVTCIEEDTRKYKEK